MPNWPDGACGLAQATFILLISFLDLAYRSVRFNSLHGKVLKLEA